MTLDEMQAWLEELDGGEEEGAVVTAFKLARDNPESEGYLEKFADAIEPNEYSLFHIAFGHYIAVMAIDELAARRGVPPRDPQMPVRVQ